MDMSKWNSDDRINCGLNYKAKVAFPVIYDKFDFICFWTGEYDVFSISVIA